MNSISGTQQFYEQVEMMKIDEFESRCALFLKRENKFSSISMKELSSYDDDGNNNDQDGSESFDQFVKESQSIVKDVINQQKSKIKNYQPEINNEESNQDLNQFFFFFKKSVGITRLKVGEKLKTYRKFSEVICATLQLVEELSGKIHRRKAIIEFVNKNIHKKQSYNYNLEDFRKLFSDPVGAQIGRIFFGKEFWIQRMMLSDKLSKYDLPFKYFTVFLRGSLEPKKLVKIK